MALVAAGSLLRERMDRPIRSTPKRQAGNTGSDRVWGKGTDEMVHLRVV